MDDCYRLSNTDQLLSPSLVVYPEIVERNLARMISIAGGVDRLRPHCKTHKIPQITQKQLALGITKHKCATLAEAEMLARAGVKDIFLAYNPVGPNIERCIQLATSYSTLRLSVSADHPDPIRALGAACKQAGVEIGVVLDIDTGLHRTGVAPNGGAVTLYRQIVDTEGVTSEGLHVYDGQHHQTDAAERRAAVMRFWPKVVRLRQQLHERGCSVPRVVAGGTGSFPIYAELDDESLELSPGTPVLQDAGYRDTFPDLPFEVAALLLTRVVSRPDSHHITLDLGTKACASDPPAGRRLVFPDIPDAREVLHNEEHLVLQTDRANDFQPGDVCFAIPRHICPTTALHQFVYVGRNGYAQEAWTVVARDRQLTI